MKFKRSKICLKNKKTQYSYHYSKQEFLTILLYFIYYTNSVFAIFRVFMESGATGKFDTILLFLWEWWHFFTKSGRSCIPTSVTRRCTDKNICDINYRPSIYCSQDMLTMFLPKSISRASSTFVCSFECTALRWIWEDR